MTQEHRRKISENNAKFWLGKKLSNETKKKMSIAHKGKNMGENHPRWKGGISFKPKKSNWLKYLFGEKRIMNKKFKNSTFWMRKWRAENPEKARFERHVYKMRKKNAQGSHTMQEWIDLKVKFNFMCLCCKRFEPEIKLTEDHIVPLKMGGTDTINNIQPLCNKCNISKYTKTISYLPLSSNNLIYEVEGV